MLLLMFIFIVIKGFSASEADVKGCIPHRQCVVIDDGLYARGRVLKSLSDIRDGEKEKLLEYFTKSSTEGQCDVDGHTSDTGVCSPLVHLEHVISERLYAQIFTRFEKMGLEDNDDLTIGFEGDKMLVILTNKGIIDISLSDDEGVLCDYKGFASLVESARKSLDDFPRAFLIALYGNQKNSVALRHRERWSKLKNISQHTVGSIKSVFAGE